AAKEQAAKEQAAKEQAAKEQAAKDAAARAAREQAAARAAKEEAAARAAKEEAPIERVLQDQFLNVVTTSQDAALRLAKIWARTLDLVPPVPIGTVPTPNPDDYSAFVEKLWTGNRDFVFSLYELVSGFGSKLVQGR
ncbi:MAG: hypothetical protein QOH66_2103, partial [Actinomycetota bacterium]|nr:hypothetical protein [Actinomycetota bacterium]